MKHFVAAGLLLLMAVGLLSGCQSTGEQESLPSESEDFFVDNPFETDDDAYANILGRIGHGPTDFAVDEDGFRIPYVYHGGQFELAYQVTAAGTAKNVGFLLFLDGIPQPYQVNGEGDVEYMHMFELEEDDQEYPFSFVFTPVAGRDGETLGLKIYSVYYPQFQPDMVTSSSYGLYYSTLESVLEMTFQADSYADGTNAAAQTVAALSSVTVTSDNMTSDFVSSRLNSSFMINGQSAEDLLEDRVYCFIDYDGETAVDNLDVSGRNSVHISFQMVGVPGAVYRVSLFANHQPVTDGEAVCWEVPLSKGKVVTLEADIDVSALDDLTTFYVMACPADKGIVSDSAVLSGEMIGPILFYKGVSK